MKKILLCALAFGWASFLYSQDRADADSILHAPHDTVEFGFGKLGFEKGGQVCENGLEKLELAMDSKGGIVGINLTDFHGPSLTRGRFLFMAIQEKNEHSGTTRFFDAGIDLTWKEFPVHLGLVIGMDMIQHNPNVTYAGPALSVYLSDIEVVHHFFHILRSSMSYSKYKEYIQETTTSENETHVGRKWENSTFFQLQPFYLTKNLSIFTEGIFRIRKGNNFSEVEFGLRHHRFLEGKIGLGVKFGFEDMLFHNASIIARFNLSNPNPRHTKHENISMFSIKPGSVYAPGFSFAKNATIWYSGHAPQKGYFPCK